jgi:hypothetical protein
LAFCYSLRSFHNGNFQATLAAMRQWEDECAIQSSAFRVLNYMHLIKNTKSKLQFVKQEGSISFSYASIKRFLQRITATGGQSLTEDFHSCIHALGAISFGSIDAVTAIFRVNGLPVPVELLLQEFPRDPVEHTIPLHAMLIKILLSCIL